MRGSAGKAIGGRDIGHRPTRGKARSGSLSPRISWKAEKVGDLPARSASRHAGRTDRVTGMAPTISKKAGAFWPHQGARLNPGLCFGFRSNKAYQQPAVRNPPGREGQTNSRSLMLRRYFDSIVGEICRSRRLARVSLRDRPSLLRRFHFPRPPLRLSDPESSPRAGRVKSRFLTGGRIVASHRRGRRTDFM